LQKKRRGIDPGIFFQQGEVWDLDESLRFDVIICPFFLDLFDGKMLIKIIKKLDSHLKPSGNLLYADFQQAKGVKKLWSSVLIRVMYFFFGLIARISAKKLEDPWLHLKELGYQSALRRSGRNSMIRAEIFLKKLPE
jgi:2-polyprenyl-3-methyl-5-hydroxy-6-metoxy-1,4-benzoquinol methylase